MPKKRTTKKNSNPVVWVAIVAIVVLVFLAIVMTFYFINASRQARVMGLPGSGLPGVLKSQGVSRPGTAGKVAVPVVQPRPVAAPVVRPLYGPAAPARRIERRNVYYHNNN